DGFWFGYADGSMGSVDHEPIEGHRLLRLRVDQYGEFGGLLFEGDCAAILAGKSIYVDEVGGYPLTGVSFDGDYTEADFTLPGLTAGQSYFIEFRDDVTPQLDFSNPDTSLFLLAF